MSNVDLSIRPAARGSDGGGGGVSPRTVAGPCKGLGGTSAADGLDSGATEDERAVAGLRQEIARGLERRAGESASAHAQRVEGDVQELRAYGEGEGGTTLGPEWDQFLTVDTAELEGMGMVELTEAVKQRVGEINNTIALISNMNKAHAEARLTAIRNLLA